MDDPTTRAARTDAVRALEAEFSALFTQYRRVIAEQSERVSPGMLPGAYKVFTTIVRSDEITLSVLAERLLMDKGQLSRTVRELEQLGLVHRAPDPSDGRSSLLSPTDEGRARLEAARTTDGSPLLAALERWPVDDIRSFTRYIHALVAEEPPR